MTGELERMLSDRGAGLAGFADLRGLPAGEVGGWITALAIVVPLNPEIVSRLPLGPQADYAREYHEVNALLDGLGLAAEEWLLRRGLPAQALTRSRAVYGPSFKTAFPHKTAARLAGLGWIGKNALLVTREFGCAQRLTSVLIRAPLAPGAPPAADGCRRCRKCLEACPGRALSGQNYRPGLEREALFDLEACRSALAARYAAAPEDEKPRLYKDASCGLCLALCPWTRRYLNRRGFPAAG